MIARLNAGMSQGALADAIGVSRQTVNNYERGSVEPRRIVFNAWAMATGVPASWLIDGIVPNGDGPDGGLSAVPDSGASD